MLQDRIAMTARVKETTVLGVDPVTQRNKTKKDRGKTIEQFCSVCKKTFEMPVVEEGDNQDVIWLNCPGCRGYLPHMTNQEDIAEAEENEGGRGRRERRRSRYRGSLHGRCA